MPLENPDICPDWQHVCLTGSPGHTTCPGRQAFLDPDMTGMGVFFLLERSIVFLLFVLVLSVIVRALVHVNGFVRLGIQYWQ